MKVTEDRKLEALDTMEGSGVRVRRLFPSSGIKYLDPFVLLDEFFVEPTTGFPPHPHRGFEALTYMIEGSFRHKDNLGNDTEVFPGGVQKFTAGKGLYHSEMPGEGPLNHGFQLWINLPKSLKEMEPSYEQFDPERLPENGGEGIRVRTLVGDSSPVKLNTNVIFKDVHLEAGHTYTADHPDGLAGFIYLYGGRLAVEGSSIKPGEAILLNGDGGLEVKGEEQSRLILLAGEPHGEPIRQLGPFVD
jgi:redox-sensitive bicupin YhaK (pirin superfamily)